MATHSAYVTRGQAFERDMDYLPDRITAEPGRSRDAREPQPLEPPTWPVGPSQIVPLGPDESGWHAPHGRERL